MDEDRYDCIICGDIWDLSAHEMVVHFETIHTAYAAASLEAIRAEDEQKRSLAWLN